MGGLTGKLAAAKEAASNCGARALLAFGCCSRASFSSVSGGASESASRSRSHHTAAPPANPTGTAAKQGGCDARSSQPPAPPRPRPPSSPISFPQYWLQGYVTVHPAPLAPLRRRPGPAAPPAGGGSHTEGAGIPCGGPSSVFVHLRIPRIIINRRACRCIKSCMQRRNFATRKSSLTNR